MSKIQKLYNLVYNKGEDIQIRIQKGEDINRRELWKKIEDKVKDINIQDLKYNESLNTAYEIMNLYIEKYNMKENEYEPIWYHFFIQLMNLVDKKSNFKVKLKSILEIAFNAGQLNVFIKKNKIPLDIILFIKDHELLNLNSYISEYKQSIIDYYIDNELLVSGGKRYIINYS